MENIDFKKFLLLGAVSVMLYATESNFNYMQNKNDIMHSFADSDFDGVSDVYDECPDTPFLDIVKQNGCSKNQKPLSSSYLVTISSGVIYTRKKYLMNQERGNHHRKKGKPDKIQPQKETFKELYIPLNIFLSKNNRFYSLSIGYIYTKDKDETVKSLSDTYLTAGYLFDMSQKNLPVFSLSAKVKAATSKGSVKNDYSIEGGVYKNIKRHNFFADTGYTALGTLNGYKNLFYFDFDYSYDLKNSQLGISYSFSRNFYNNKNLQDITLYTSYNLNNKTKAYIGYTKAFFDSRDHQSFALTISRNF